MPVMQYGDESGQPVTASPLSPLPVTLKATDAPGLTRRSTTHLWQGVAPRNVSTGSQENLKDCVSGDNGYKATLGLVNLNACATVFLFLTTNRTVSVKWRARYHDSTGAAFPTTSEFSSSKEDNTFAGWQTATVTVQTDGTAETQEVQLIGGNFKAADDLEVWIANASGNTAAVNGVIRGFV